MKKVFYIILIILGLIFVGGNFILGRMMTGLVGLIFTGLFIGACVLNESCSSL